MHSFPKWRPRMSKAKGYPENAIAPAKGNPKYLKSGDGLEFAGAKKINSETSTVRATLKCAKEFFEPPSGWWR
jgi:hypothetical protein